MVYEYTLTGASSGGFNIVVLLAILFILSQLIALRNKDALLSLHLQYSFVCSYALIYLVNYLTFLMVEYDSPYSMFLIEVILAVGFFILPIIAMIDRLQSQVGKRRD